MHHNTLIPICFFFSSSSFCHTILCFLLAEPLDSPSIKVHVLHQYGPDGLFVRASGYTILEPIYMDCIRQWDSNIQSGRLGKLESCVHFRIMQKRCQMKAKTLYILTEKEKFNCLIAYKQLCDTSMEKGFGAASDITSPKPFPNSKHEADYNRNDSK
jgi:hypothetical protein